MTGRPYGILRIRPLPIMAEGFAHDRLHAIARSFARDGTGHGLSRTFPVPLDLDVFDNETITELTEYLTALTRQTNVVLIDMDYDRAGGRYAVVDILLFQAMMKLPAELLRDRQILIIVKEPLAPTDDLTLLAEHERFRGSVIIADSAGRTSATEVPSWFEEAENPEWISLQELRDIFAGKLLRSRGVFSSNTRPHEYSAFHYSAEGCATELQQLLAAYFMDQRLGFVVYDDATSAWFSSAVKAACVAADINAYTVEDFTGTGAGEEALAAVAEVAGDDLADKDKRFAVVTSAYKTGRRISQLWRACRELGRDDAKLLAVFCHCPGEEALDSGVWQTISVPFDGIDVDLDYLAAVDIALLQENSWEVRAARLANEIEPMSGPWRKPSTVSMLTLFAAYGSAGEYAVPATRAGIRSFPQLRNLDEWDALWLAEAMIKSIEIELGCPRSQILVVAPDEGTAIRRISEAVEQRLAVAIAKVERRVIKDKLDLPDKVATIIRRYRSSKIALLDESAVTYRTLAALDDIVRKTIGRSADVSASVVELPLDGAQRPENMLSLIRWKPLLFTR